MVNATQGLQYESMYSTQVTYECKAKLCFPFTGINSIHDNPLAIHCANGKGGFLARVKLHPEVISALMVLGQGLCS